MTKKSPSPPVNIAHYGNLLRAIEGLHNWRAMLLSVIYLGVTLLIAYLGTSLAFSMDASGFILKLFGALAVLVAFCGVSAVGLTLIDQAQGLPSRPLLLAVWDSVGAALRILAVGLIGLVIVLVFYILMVAILFVCKLPGIGPILYGVAFPVLVLVGGLLLFSITVTLSMTGPAIWNGASIRGAVAMLWQIVTKRTVELLVSLILLSLLSALVGYIVFAILGSGLFSVASLSTAILDFDTSTDLFRLLSILLGRRSYGYGNGSDVVNYLEAAAFGGTVLLVLVISALNAVVLLGLNLIYLKLSADLDPSETEKMIGQRLAEAREKALAIKEESQRRLEKAREVRRQQQEAAAQAAAIQTETQAPAQATAQTPIPEATTTISETTASATPATPIQPAASLCPQCQTPITSGDLFCGECGKKLS